MKELIFHPAAERELGEAAKYYESQSKGLGLRFLLEAEKGLLQILERPEAWPPLVYRQIRRYLLHYFPYGIVYRKDHEIIYILSIMHLSRKPRYWRNRKF